MASYMLLAIPIAHAVPFNRVINVRNMDSGDTLFLRASTDGQEPATHVYGGWPPADESEMNFYQNPAGNPFDPPGGFPIGDDVTEQEAADARAAAEVIVRSGPNSGTLPQAAMEAMFADLGITPIVVDP